MYVVELKRENIHHGIFFEPIVLKYEIACSGTILIPLLHFFCHAIFVTTSILYIVSISRADLDIKNVCMMYGESFKFLNKIFQ